MDSTLETNESQETLPREELLFRFKTVAGQVLSEADPDDTPDKTVERLLPLLVTEIPQSAFEDVLPHHEGIVFIHGDIVEEDVPALCSDLMRVHLNLKEDKAIQIHYSSEGGSINGGLALCSTIHQIQRAGRDVNIHIQGVAMSMGSLVAQVCDTRTIEESAFMMIHELTEENIRGRLSHIKCEVAYSQMVEDACNRIYSARTGKPPSYYADKTAVANYYLTAQQALEEKLVDQVIPMPRFTYTPPAPPRQRRSARRNEDTNGN